ncbi:unnamed protein product [Amoebophrya sp. A120]|nr:unnamed protein product [Amoebophrya sp. A120]|eukprot:GSA120T00018355001.1
MGSTFVPKMFFSSMLFTEHDHEAGSTGERRGPSSEVGLRQGLVARSGPSLGVQLPSR